MGMFLFDKPILLGKHIMSYKNLLHTKRHQPLLVNRVFHPHKSDAQGFLYKNRLQTKATYVNIALKAKEWQKVCFDTNGTP